GLRDRRERQARLLRGQSIRRGPARTVGRLLPERQPRGRDHLRYPRRRQAPLLGRQQLWAGPPWTVSRLICERQRRGVALWRPHRRRRHLLGKRNPRTAARFVP